VPKISFVFRTDVHVADKGPASWKGDYSEEIWSNLEQVGQLAVKYGADAVLDGGDYFHVKTASRNSHALIYRTAEIHRGYPCPTYCVEGNHDITYNNLGSIERQPLGVLYASGIFKHLRDVVFESEGMRVRVVGVPYNPKQTLEDLLSIQKQPEDDYLVAVVHALAGENPPAKVEEFFGEPVFRYRDLVTPGGPDIFAFGHWHKDQGVVRIGNQQFVNHGALSRGSLTNENMSRTPNASLLEFTPERATVTVIPLRVLPAEEVFDVEQKERVETEGKSIDAFVERLQADVQFDSEESITDNLSRLDFASEVRELALGYLEQARSRG
jgi:DNA repair exonuclease SbcCD nuclease subunit